MKNLSVILPAMIAVAAFSPNGYSQGFVLPPKDSVMLWMDSNHVPIVGVGIIELGEIKTIEVFGERKDHSVAPATTIFNIASLTKPIVSTLTLKLISDGKWTLDEPLSQYWTDPDVANDPRHTKLTTRHVLTHQSGLPNWRGHEPGNKLSFAFEPGTQWKYSGEGYEYLRRALEEKFGKPIEKLADSLVFKPFGMTDTRFYWDNTMVASRYADRFRADGRPYEWETWSAANASNLVLTTVHDYCKFGLEVMKKIGLKATIFNEMITPQVTLKNQKHFGLGWLLLNPVLDNGYALAHTGSNPGIHTIVVLFPSSQRGIVVFTNGDNGEKVYKAILNHSVVGEEVLKQMK